MAKSISAKIETYKNKDGETKNKYIDVGVILENTHGEYVMLDPAVDLAGVLMKQRLLAQETGKKAGGSVICSIFDNDGASPQKTPNQSQASPQGKPEPVSNLDDLPF